jgi:hypothetical protein
VNLKTAKAPGLDIAPAPLAFVDAVTFGRLFFWPPQLAGLERAEMSRWPLRTSAHGTLATVVVSAHVRFAPAARQWTFHQSRF